MTRTMYLRKYPHMRDHPNAWTKVGIYRRRRLSLSCWNTCEIALTQVSGQSQMSTLSDTWVEVNVQHCIRQAQVVYLKSQWYLGNWRADFRCACSVFVLQGLATSFGMVINSLGLHFICDSLQYIFENSIVRDFDEKQLLQFLSPAQQIEKAHKRNGEQSIGWGASPGLPTSCIGSDWAICGGRISCVPATFPSARTRSVSVLNCCKAVLSVICLCNILDSRALNHLMEEGYIYSTVDEDHFHAKVAAAASIATSDWSSITKVTQHDLMIPALLV